MLLPLLVIAITSCTEDWYDVCEVTVVSGEGGTAIIYPSESNKIIAGWWVELTATPEKDYRFVNWTVNGKEVSRDNPYKATINTSTQFKANFEEDNFTVKVLSSEGGTAKASQEGEVLNGTKVTFTATPEEGYSFVSWTVDGEGVSTENPYTATITADTEFVANFVKQRYSVRLNNNWRQSTTISNPNPLQYDGVYESYSNYKVNNGIATMYIDIEDYDEFTIYVRSYGESNYDYVVVYELDSEYEIKTMTKGLSTSGTSISSYEQVTFSNLGGGQYTIRIDYKKDSSDSSFDDRGYVLIPKGEELEALLPVSGIENGHAYVDLGLSVKWATCNVGADTPEEYGDYFAWGETSPKDYYDWSTYKYSNGEAWSMTKYCVDSNYGKVDNKTTIELSDDAARVNWGGKWRMPTISELYELRNTSNCTWTWTTQNGVKGYKVRSKKNGKSIFLPAAGHRFNDNLDNAGDDGYYWSSSLRTDYSHHYSYYACGFDFNSSNVDYYDYHYRELGQSVRAVCP